MKKKSMKRDKKPVLTSPWKIGTLVSLLLLFMSVGVACYLVTFYHIKLAWLKTGSGGWSVDSYAFFKESYPLVAGVALTSLIAYFIVTSAVRRYKFYLDSGQDYRRMISLAESIDDLTNPAQIARLSSFPELQAVLRNYGDQIREISEGVDEKDAGVGFDELERNLDGLLAGQGPGKETIAGREYASVYGKVYDRIESDRARIEETAKRGESDRRQFARAVLFSGRVMEAVKGAGEELLAITNAATELTAVAEKLGAAPAAARGAGGASQKEFAGVVNEMESSVRKLEDGGHALSEFSEENNGIAINLALMAARGHVNEHDLATFAERVRSTAERFHRLNGTISSIAQGLLVSCRALREKAGGAAPEAPVPDRDASGAVAEIARRIEERTAALEKLIGDLGSELQGMQETVPKDRASSEPAVAASAPAPRVETANRGTGAAARRAQTEAESSAFVIDRGGAWGGMGGEETEPVKADRIMEAFSFKSVREEAPAQTARAESSPAKDAKADFEDMSSLRQLDHPAEQEADSPEAAAEARGQSWMEMPGHRWLKIDVEKAEAEEPGNVEVTVERTSASAPPAAEAPAAEAPARSEEDAVFESAEEAPLSSDADEDEPVRDLFELGAVEYIEPSPARR